MYEIETEDGYKVALVLANIVNLRYDTERGYYAVFMSDGTSYKLTESQYTAIKGKLG